MFEFIRSDTDGTYTLSQSDENDVWTILVTDLTENDLGMIVLAAVSVINPAMGDMMRGLMQNG